MRLYCDPSVRFGGREVGGVRIDALSHIKGPLSLTLSQTRGKKAKHVIQPLQAPEQRQQGNGTANLNALAEEHGIPLDVIADWHVEKGWGNLPPEGDPKRAEFAAFIVSRPSLLDELKQFAEMMSGDDFNYGEE